MSTVYLESTEVSLTGKHFTVHFRVARYLDKPRVRVTVRGHTRQALDACKGVNIHTFYLPVDELATRLINRSDIEVSDTLL